MTKVVTTVKAIPHVPTLYAMFGGALDQGYVAYVGVADSLRRRIEQHLVRRDSSVTTGASAVVLNPDYITAIDWWKNPIFVNRLTLEAAEMVAFDVLNPVLRSRRAVRAESRALYADPAFYLQFKQLVESPPTGRLIRPSLEGAMQRIVELEERLARVEHMLLTQGDEPAGAQLREAGNAVYDQLADRIVCNVSHNFKGNPMLFLPDRSTHPGIPRGLVDVIADGMECQANFVEVAVNVVREAGRGKNILPDLLRSWFGEDAGQPGRGEQVVFDRDGQRYRMTPVTKV